MQTDGYQHMMTTCPEIQVPGVFTCFTLIPQLHLQIAIHTHVLFCGIGLGRRLGKEIGREGGWERDNASISHNDKMKLLHNC